MEDSFGKVIAIILCAIQMFIIPLYWYQDNIKRLEQTYIISEITYNVDNFRNTGIIDETQYNNMRDRIYSLSGSYDIKITHCVFEDDIEYMYFEGDIEDRLEDEGIYYLSKDDYINIYINDKSGNVVGCYGGSVKNEAY